MCLAETSKTAPHQHVVATEPAAVGRRSFLRASALAAAGTAVAGLGPAAPAAAAGPGHGHPGPGHGHHGRHRGVVDLTHRFTTDFPVFTQVQPTRETATTIAEDGFYAQNWTFTEHTATHVDAPGHFAPGMPLVDELDPDALVAPIVVIDIRRRARRNPDAEVTVDDLRRYERRHGRIPRHALVCMYSGWSRFADDPAVFLGGPAYPEYHFPGFGVEAALWLARRRDVVGIGVDTTSLDPGNSTTFAVHNEFLATGRYGVENLTNLGRLRRRHRTAVVGVVPWQDGSGGPCRVIAI